mmetsp:Transcript_33845/g.102109  ORF Transcript_33845/g.102109 Transcript_33845/m.102109 type:complete len:231 (-) Transcript_33845:533-1225(-)
MRQHVDAVHGTPRHVHEAVQHLHIRLVEDEILRLEEARDPELGDPRDEVGHVVAGLERAPHHLGVFWRQQLVGREHGWVPPRCDGFVHTVGKLTQDDPRLERRHECLRYQWLVKANQFVQPFGNVVSVHVQPLLNLIHPTVSLLDRVGRLARSLIAGLGRLASSLLQRRVLRRCNRLVVDHLGTIVAAGDRFSVGSGRLALEAPQIGRAALRGSGSTAPASPRHGLDVGS